MGRLTEVSPFDIQSQKYSIRSVEMKRRLSSYHAPAPICLGCALALLFACCREYKERKPTESVKSKPTVVTNLERAANCGCAARELIFANAALGISTCERNVETKDTIEAVKRELVDVARATDGKLRVVDAEEAAELAGAMSFGAQNSVDGGDRMKNGGIATPLLLVIVSNPLTSEFASPARLLIKVLL